METQQVALIAFDHYARVHENKLVFDSLIETYFELSKPDDRFALQYEGRFVGVDSTLYTIDPFNQYYLTDNRGNYESFFVGTVEGSGLLVAFVQYINQGVNNTASFISIPVTLKVKP